MVVVEDHHSGEGGGVQLGGEPLAAGELSRGRGQLDAAVGVLYPQVGQPDVEVLVLLEHVVVDDGDVERLVALAGPEDQRASVNRNVRDN